MSAGVLDGIRVLDFGRFVAAPCCAAMLGDLGAEVIRVEKREGGEDRWLGPVTDAGEGGMFLQNNRNKLSLTLDPTVPEGAEVTKRLILSADVVVANLPEKALAAMGLTHDQLKATKPDIILATASAYGRGGPYSDRLGFDAVGQVMSGAVSRSGWPDQPVRTIVPYVDFSTALAMTVGALAALMARGQTGAGQHVEASLLSTSLMMTSAMLIEQAVIAPNRVAALNRGQLSAPNNIYATRDGFVLVQVVDARMAEWCRARSRAEALAQLEAARVPAYPVNSIQDALDDPHVAAMGYLRPTDYPGLPKPAPIVEQPFRLSGSEVGMRRRAPILGEHTDAILASLGYGADEIAGLRERRVV